MRDQNIKAYASVGRGSRVGNEAWRDRAPLKTPIQWLPNPRRSHECERGTQECARHGASSLALVGCRPMITPLKTQSRLLGPLGRVLKKELAGESACPTLTLSLSSANSLPA